MVGYSVKTRAKARDEREEIKMKKIYINEKDINISNIEESIQEKNRKEQEQDGKVYEDETSLNAYSGFSLQNRQKNGENNSEDLDQDFQTRDEGFPSNREDENFHPEAWLRI